MSSPALRAPDRLVSVRGVHFLRWSARALDLSTYIKFMIYILTMYNSFMKIAIISDTHDRLDNIEKALNYIKEQGAEILIHAGDLAHSETLEYVCKKFHGDIFYIGGNADIDNEEIKKLEKIYKTLKTFTETAKLTLGGLSLVITHKPMDAKKLAESGKYDLVIHGHDHKPWQSFIGKCEILNPGNLADTRYPATFALYNTEIKKASLIAIQSLT